MKVIVLGSRGMLGSELCKALEAEKYYVLGFDLPDVDITDYRNMREVVPHCDCIINCAAYTRVDDAEKESDIAYKINSDGARNVAKFCESKRIYLVHLSTDYVFDGRNRRPYDESAIPNPLNLYGSSKVAGEKAIRSEGGKFLIVRTQALFGLNGPNFVASIINKLEEGGPLKVVDDQVVAPTYARHLAEGLIRLLGLRKEGLIHLSSSGECSWYDFAQAIAKRVRPDAVVERCSTGDISYPARRPMYTVLDKARYLSWVGHRMPSWEDGLDDYLEEFSIADCRFSVGEIEEKN